MPVNLQAPLGAGYDEAALAAAYRRAEALGYTLVRVDKPDERLAAWIDWRFAPSWWSSEVRSGSAWYAQRNGAIAGFAAFGTRERRFRWLRRYEGRDDLGILGPIGVAKEHRRSGLGEALTAAALCSLAPRASNALIPAVDGARLVAMLERRTGARVVDRYETTLPRARAVIMASGEGTNAQAVIDAVAEGSLALDLVGIVSDRGSAPVLDRARKAGIVAVPLAWNRARESRENFDRRIITAVGKLAPDLVLLLGFMHLLPAAFLASFPETINLHPAFLPFDPARDDVMLPDGSTIPAFRGARSLEATVAANARWSGVSVHRVTAAADRGAILVRTPLALDDTPSVEQLHERIQPLEHAAVAAAIRRWGFER
jgi:phosphoribosylglycinamide formyltransferase 1